MIDWPKGRNAFAERLEFVSQVETQFVSPDPWSHGSSYQENFELSLDSDFLSEDFCVMEGRYFFVRGVAQVIVEDLQRPFAFGCWSTLSRENFEFYLSCFDTGLDEEDVVFPGWFSNRIPTFEDTRATSCDVHLQMNRQRPHLVLCDKSSEFGRAQTEGISAERLFEVLDAIHL